MSTRLTSIIKTAGLVLMVVSITMLAPVLVCLYYGENHIAASFGHAIWSGFIIGAVMFFPTRHKRTSYNVRDGYLFLVTAWLTASVFGAVPFLYSGVLSNPFDAFFEASSAFTTTGATIFTDIESVPNGLILWRSVMSWLGGLGILVFAVALLPSLGINGTSVAERDKPQAVFSSLTSLAPRIASTLVVLYSALTLLETILLKIGGMCMFDSIVHSMSAVSTGGFSSYNDGLMHFDSVYIRIIIVIFMLICGTNFTMFYSFTRRGLKAFTEDSEFKAYLTLLAAAFGVIFVGLFFTDTGWTHSGEAANSAFQVVSILTTTGFVSDDFTMWPAFCQMILMLLMMVGACSSSSGSGNKIVRFIVVFRLVIHGMTTRLHASVVKPVTLNGKEVPNDVVSAVSNHMFLYMVMLFAGAFVMSFENLHPLDCFTTTISLLGNVGPSIGSVGIHGGYADMNFFTKFFMSLEMIAGRLELYTVLVIFTPGFWRSV